MRASILRAGVFAIALVTAAGGASAQGEFDAGMFAYLRGDYAAALEQLLPLAQRGNADAQFFLGQMYEEGQGVQRDPAAARRWYRAAADQGQGDALNALARLDEAQGIARQAPGQGNREAARGQKDESSAGSLDDAIAAYEGGDYAAAASRFEALAEAGSERAHYYLGLLYENGLGVAQDYAAAARHYREAAQFGDGEAQFNLAALYETGRGVPQDYDEAHRWYSASVARGQPKGKAAVERLSAIRFGKLPEGTGLDAAEAAYEDMRYAWAAEQFRALAEQGDVAAQLRLGGMYLGGRGVPPDVAEGRRWLRMAADKGDGTAQFALAESYARMSYGEAPDYAEAVRWYRAAAAQGNPDAQMALGRAYSDGQGVVPARTEADRRYASAHRARNAVDLLAKSWCAAAADVAALAEVYAACNRNDGLAARKSLVKLAKTGEPTAQTWLGTLYYASREIPLEQNFHEGARWMRAAAEQGDSTAQYNLGVIYEHGMGVAEDPAEAVRWYQAAAAAGDAYANAALLILGALPGAEMDGESAALRPAVAAGDGGALGQLVTLAFSGDADAQALLGAFYLSGRYYSQDYAEALKNFRAAADKDEAAARFLLGMMHEHGLGTSPDRGEAARWYEAAADAGFEPAEAALARLGE